MAAAPQLDDFVHALSEAGWEVRSAVEGHAFGSWLIEVDDGRVRVFYDGSQGQLHVARETSRDHWAGVWKATSPEQQTPEAVVLGMLESLP